MRLRDTTVGSRLDSFFQFRGDLRTQLLALAMLPVLVFAIVWGAYVIKQRANDLQAQLQERAQLLARQMAVAADYGIFSGNQGALQNLTLAVSREPAVMAATIYGANQEIFASHHSVEAETNSQNINIDIHALSNQFASQGSAQFRNNEARWIAYLEPVRSPSLSIEDISEQGQNMPIKGFIVVVISSKGIAVELIRFVLSVLTLLIGVLASSWVIVRSFSSRIDRRIQAVALAAQQIGQGKAGVRLGPSNTAIFDRLSTDLNRMAERLEQSRQELEQRVELATVAMREQRDTAERANTAKTRFLAAASHDLRQPMHALSLLFDALRYEQSSQQRNDLLERIESTTQTMSTLLDSLLDISRLDAGGVQAQPTTCELLPLLLSVRDTHDILAQRKGIDLHIRPTKLWIHSDPILFQRILGNFVSNAIRYTPPGGHVLVTARNRGQHCLIQVRDNGPGIAPEYQQTIFEEFVQIHNPQRDRSHGLGLGLAIVQRLAQLLRHPVELRSCPGQGSTFGLLIPTADHASKTAVLAQNQAIKSMPAGQAGDSNLVGCRLLLVEDDTLVRESYERLLTLWGCNVSSHSTATSALTHLRAENWMPQIIISDFLLGDGVNGLELIAEARMHSSTPIPAALITGNTEDPKLRQLHDHSTRILFKPVKPAILIKTLLELRSVGSFQQKPQ